MPANHQSQGPDQGEVKSEAAQSVSLTIGNFDGVHLGHQALLARCEAASVHAMFFDPHPRVFFGRGAAPRLLTEVERRAELLRHFGADEVDIQTFDAPFAEQSPEAFLEAVIQKRHSATQVVVGPDFRFGHKAEGDVALLRARGNAMGFEVVVVEAVCRDGEVVSSTRVRNALGRGDVEDAAACLGRFPDSFGEVVRGDARGRTIGFPTANLSLGDGMVVPADGVYAVRVQRGEEELLGMANLGTRPTVRAGRSVEVHLFDFDEDLYGEKLHVFWCARIRDEKRFDGLDGLVEQLKRDEEFSRKTLGELQEVVWI